MEEIMKSRIITKKQIDKYLMNPYFVSEVRLRKREKVVYVPIGELYEEKILIKKKIKEEGTYLILK